MRDFASDDIAQLNEWAAARGLPCYRREALPKTGRIEPGVAAGFLYLTDSSLAMMENFVSNPAAGLRVRSAALDQIAESLIAAAKSLGYRQVVSLCASAGIMRRASKKFRMRSAGDVELAVLEV